MPVFANPAHPTGPEDRPFKERSITFYGDGRKAELTLAYPDPDQVIDRVNNAAVNVYGKHQTPLSMNFNYSGHFWQGIFGRVGVDVKLKVNDPNLPKWNDISDLFSELKLHQINRNKLTENEVSKTRQEWLSPEIVQINGFPCIKQDVKIGGNSLGEIHYYFLFSPDRAIEVKFSLIDNSARPGLVTSDWRPRAEYFLNKLILSIRFRVEEKGGVN